MKPLRVVLTLIEPPLPFGSAAARWYYVLLKGLVERGHRVTAFVATQSREEVNKARALFPAPRYDLRFFPYSSLSGMSAKWRTLKRPYSYMFSEEFERALRAELARGFDILHLEQLWSGWMGLGHEDRALVSVHYLMSIDLGSIGPAKPRLWLEKRAMIQSEKSLIRRFRFFKSISPRIADEIRRHHPDAVVESIPAGIDDQQYAFIPSEKRTREPVVSVIGSMNWYPSRSAAERFLDRLWPEIKRRVPEAKAQVVGREARSALSKYLGREDVRIEENVPEIQPYFERTGVLLYAPERGSGMKIKILEALGFGVPIVTTSEGVEGLPARDGIEASICDDDAGLIDRTIALLGDLLAQERQRVAGRALLESCCGPKPTLDALERIYERIVESQGEK